VLFQLFGYRQAPPHSAAKSCPTGLAQQLQGQPKETGQPPMRRGEGRLMCLLLAMLPAVHPQGTGKSPEPARESAATVALPGRACPLSRLPLLPIPVSPPMHRPPLLMSGSAGRATVMGAVVSGTRGSRPVRVLAAVRHPLHTPASRERSSHRRFRKRCERCPQDTGMAPAVPEGRRRTLSRVRHGWHRESR
jgi:hypothetical protein